MVAIDSDRSFSSAESKGAPTCTNILGIPALLASALGTKSSGETHGELPALWSASDKAAIGMKIAHKQALTFS